MEHLPGWIILAVNVLIVIALVVWRAFFSKPKAGFTHRGIGVIYRENTVQPWEGIMVLIDSILDQYDAEGFDIDRETWSRFMIEVFPYGEPFITRDHPTGWLHTNGRLEGFPVARPTNESEAAERAIVNGGRRIYKQWPWSKPLWILQVRQLRHGGTVIDHRLMRGDGRTKSAGWSAAHHEHAEHLVSVALYGDPNHAHKRDNLKALKQRMRERYNASWKEQRE